MPNNSESRIMALLYIAERDFSYAFLRSARIDELNLAIREEMRSRRYEPESFKKQFGFRLARLGIKILNQQL